MTIQVVKDYSDINNYFGYIIIEIYIEYGHTNSLNNENSAYVFMDQSAVD